MAIREHAAQRLIKTPVSPAPLARIALLLLALTGAAAPARATPPAARLAALARGVNVTNWFRFPASTEPAAIAAYLSDAAIGDLRRAGFTFVRLPFDPLFAATAANRSLLVAQIRRLQAAGLGVVLVPCSATWHLEDRAEDRASLLDTWRRLAPALRALPAGRTFPEIVNEPVFPGAAPGWDALQAAALAILRRILPADTVILDGADWSSIAGLEELRPVDDPDVVYSFHFYDPAELTSLAAYRPGLDRAALARLPFPSAAPAACADAAGSSDPPTRALVAYVCRQGWDEAAIGARIERAAAWGRLHHAAVLLGEFGASSRLNAKARLAWITSVRAAAERAGMGWALWGYDDVMGFDLPRPPGMHPALDARLLAALGLKAPGCGRNGCGLPKS